MPVPSPRNKILPARGDYADLLTNVASLLDGEICYAIDQDQYYQNEAGTLVAVGATKAQGLLADSALQPGDNISELVNDAGYITAAQVPADTVTSVNTQTGVVVLDADDISDTSTTNKYTTAADITKLAGIEDNATADQTGAEIKAAYEAEANTNAFTDAEKTKLAGIADGAEVNAVTSVAGKTGVVTLDKSDVGLSNVDNTSDANKPISTATQTALGGKADLVGGVLDTAQLPDIAVSEYKGNVADQTAMLAVTGEKGDWVIRNDDSKVYVITGNDPSVVGGWTALSYPAGFSGNYADLSGLPTLGTAAATDATDYATAAQGALADSALQSADIGVTVQAYDANLPAGSTILVDGDVGVTVQAYDADIVVTDAVPTFTATVQTTERTITAGAFDLATGNHWTCGAITVPAPTNATAGTSGLIRVTAGPVTWNAVFKFPGGTAPTIASFPAVFPFYVVSGTEILMGNIAEGIA